MINVVVLQGRVAKDPEMKRTTSGESVCTFRIASDDLYGKSKKTIFMGVSAWGKQAEFCSKYFKKGMMVGVSGKLTQSKYTNRQGVEVTITEIMADHVDFMGSKGDSGKQAEEPQEQNNKPRGANLESIEVNEDDLPF